MGKVQILLSSRWTDVILQNYMAKRMRIYALTVMTLTKISVVHVTPDYSISMLDEWRKDNTNICYLAEATPDNSDYINGRLRMRVVDGDYPIYQAFHIGNGTAFLQIGTARSTLDTTKELFQRECTGASTHVRKP